MHVISNSAVSRWSGTPLQECYWTPTALPEIHHIIFVSHGNIVQYFTSYQRFSDTAIEYANTNMTVRGVILHPSSSNTHVNYIFFSSDTSTVLSVYRVNKPLDLFRDTQAQLRIRDVHRIRYSRAYNSNVTCMNQINKTYLYQQTEANVSN